MKQEQVLEHKLTEQEVKEKELSQENLNIRKTALTLLDDYKPTRLSKVQRVRRNKALIDSSLNGETPTRLNSLPSFLVYHVVKLFSTLIGIPDKRLIIAGTSKPVSHVMAHYVDVVMREGGYHEALMSGWSGYKEAGLNGNMMLAMGIKDNGMPRFNCLPIENFSFTPMSNKLRTATGIGETGRYVYSIMLTLQRAEQQFPGLLKVAEAGILPNAETLQQNQELTEEQVAMIEENKIIQIAQLVDKDFKVKAVIAGGNAALYKADTGEDFPLVMDIDGEKQSFLDVVKFDFEKLPSGIYAAGAGDMFGNFNDTETKLNSSMANVAIDNNNAAPIINIPGVESESIFQQLKMAERAIAEGKQAYVPFDPADNNGQALGQSSIDYIRKTFNEGEAAAVIATIERIVKRSGFKLDFLFTDASLTNLQTRLDMEANNQNIIDIQSHNLDFYKMPVLFTIFAIQKFGKLKDKLAKREFATDLKINIEEEEITIGELQEVMGQKPLTRGKVVKMFKDAKKENKDIIVEVDVKTGVSFNKTLEEDTLLKRLRTLDPTSQAFAETNSELSQLLGGKAITQEASQPAQGGKAPEGISKEIETAISQ